MKFAYGTEKSKVRSIGFFISKFGFLISFWKWYVGFGDPMPDDVMNVKGERP